MKSLYDGGSLIDEPMGPVATPLSGPGRLHGVITGDGVNEPPAYGSTSSAPATGLAPGQYQVIPPGHVFGNDPLGQDANGNPTGIGSNGKVFTLINGQWVMNPDPPPAPLATIAAPIGLLSPPLPNRTPDPETPRSVTVPADVPTTAGGSGPTASAPTPASLTPSLGDTLAQLVGGSSGLTNPLTAVGTPTQGALESITPTATPKSASGNTALIVLVLAAIAGVVAFVILRHKKKLAPGAPPNAN